LSGGTELGFGLGQQFPVFCSHFYKGLAFYDVGGGFQVVVGSDLEGAVARVCCILELTVAAIGCRQAEGNIPRKNRRLRGLPPGRT